MLLNCGVGEDCFESPLDCKEIQPVHPKDQSWVFIGRAETPILWPPHVKSWLIWKDPDAGRDWGQEEKGTTEDEMAGWHHRLDGHEFGWTLGVGDGQGSLACCNSWFAKSWTWLSNWTELNWTDIPTSLQFEDSMEHVLCCLVDSHHFICPQLCLNLDGIIHRANEIGFLLGLNKKECIKLFLLS